MHLEDPSILIFNCMCLAHCETLLLLVTHCMILTLCSLQNPCFASWRLHVAGILQYLAFAVFLIACSSHFEEICLWCFYFAFDFTMWYNSFVFSKLHVAHSLQNSSLAVFSCTLQRRYFIISSLHMFLDYKILFMFF